MKAQKEVPEHLRKVAERTRHKDRVKRARGVWGPEAQSALQNASNGLEGKEALLYPPPVQDATERLVEALEGIEATLDLILAELLRGNEES